MKTIDEESEEMMTTPDEIKDYIHSDEFKQTLEKAAPSRMKILTEFTPEMKDIKVEFVEYMMNAAKDSDEDEKELQKKFRKIFKKVVDYHHYQGGWPKPNTPAKLETLAENVEYALKYLDFAQIREFRDRLEAHGIYIDDKKTKTLKDDFPNLNEETWENLRDMLDDGSTCQGKIHNSADEIKINIFEEDVPEEMRFSKDNKCGIKKGPFNKMVTAEAMKKIKTEEKMKKYMTNLSEASIFNISREELLKERFTDMLEEN